MTHGRPHPIVHMAPAHNLAGTVALCLARRRFVELYTVVRSGEPLHIAVGGGCVEALVRSAARDVLLVTRESRCLPVRLTEKAEGGTGDVCGGTMELFLDYLCPEGSDV